MKPPIIILTLKDRVARRTRLLSVLKTQGVPYELWFAVDGRNGLPQKYEHLVDRQQIFKNLHRDLGEAEIACALSHQLIYKEILDRNLKAAIILEDDAIIDETFFDFYRAEQNFNYDLLLLHYNTTIVSRFDTLKQGRKIMGYRSLTSPFSTLGYVITRKGAKKISDQSMPVSYVADWPIDLSKILTYAAIPKIVEAPSGTNIDSDIQKGRLENDHTTSLKKLNRIKRYKLSNILDWKVWYRRLLGKKVN